MLKNLHLIHPKTEIGTRIVGYCDDRPGLVVSGWIVEGLWDFGLEKSLNVESSVGWLFCRGLGDKNVENSADNGGLRTGL